MLFSELSPVQASIASACTTGVIGTAVFGSVRALGWIARQPGKAAAVGVSLAITFAITLHLLRSQVIAPIFAFMLAALHSGSDAPPPIISGISVDPLPMTVLLFASIVGGIASRAAVLTFEPMCVSHMCSSARFFLLLTALQGPHMLDSRHSAGAHFCSLCFLRVRAPSRTGHARLTLPTRFRGSLGLFSWILPVGTLNIGDTIFLTQALTLAFWMGRESVRDCTLPL
jgi:hypothetical protein